MFKHLFFDLDRTLWDFEANSHETLTELHHTHKLAQRGIENSDQFIKDYKRINEECWALYREGKMTKEVLRGIRFRKTFEEYGVIDEHLAEQFGADYIAICPLKNKVFDHTHEILDYLAGRYEMHIITNGFEEVQHVKLKHANLTDYFDVVVISELVGKKKPHPLVFNHALDKAKAEAGHSLMIGDDLPVDILGAQAIGMDGVYFNPEKVVHNEKPAYEISKLIEMKSFL